MEKILKIKEHFGEVETKKDYKGYSFTIVQALTIVILGTICGLKNTKQIHQWAMNTRTKEFLLEHFQIEEIPCYYWLLSMLKLIKPTSPNECFINWSQDMIVGDKKTMTVSFDGKTIRSTGKMDSYDKPLHIVSVHVADLAITIGQKTIDEKSNEIPAMRELLKLLDIEGCMVVADALNCQKETAEAVIKSGADYLLNVKDNHKELKECISDYVSDDVLRDKMDNHTLIEKGRGRIEERTAFITNDINWLFGKDEWLNLASIGAINRRVTYKELTTDEWHYYITSRDLTAEELLHHSRLEWSVETMHWFLDVHFGEDFCRIEDKDVQQNLNMIRKIVLNTIKEYKATANSKRPLSNIMFDCLLDPNHILKLLA